MPHRSPSQSDTPQIDLTARDHPTIVAELEDFVRQTRPDLWSDFFRANLGETLIEMLALVGDMLSYGQDSIANEVFVSTARREDSALRFARSIGYKPRRPTSASVTVTALSVPEEVVQNGGAVPSGQTISGLDGITYELEDNVEIPAGTTSHELTLREGENQEETFDADGQAGQTIETSFGSVEDGSWKVYVGPVVEDNLWAEVNSVAVGADDGTKTIYEVSFTSEGRLRITFGGGATGPTATTSKAPDSTITVQYRTTEGEGGNAPLSSISGSINIQVGATIATDGTIVANSGTGTTVAATYENTQNVATGGQDRESLEEMRFNIPAFLRSLDKVISIEDYDPQIIRASGIGADLVFSEPYVSSFRSNHIKVHAWTTEDVDFTAEDTTDSSVSSTVTYTRYAQFPTDRINDLRNFLDKRTMATANNVIVRPGIAWVDLYFNKVVIDPTVKKGDFHKKLTERLLHLFETSDGFTMRVADVYDVVGEITGIRTFTLDRIVVERLRRGTIKFDSNPNNGDWIDIRSNRNVSPVRFEFDNNNTNDSGGDVLVDIGNNKRESALNLARAINSNVKVEAFVAKNEDTILIEYAENVGDIRGTIDVQSAAQARFSVISRTARPSAIFIEDRRRDQNPLEDAWPTGSPTNEPKNYDPDIALSAGGGQNAGWQDTGVLPYAEIEDVDARKQRARRVFYDESYLYNNEIFYGSVSGINETIQAVNLRRLVANLTQSSRR